MDRGSFGYRIQTDETRTLGYVYLTNLQISIFITRDRKILTLLEMFHFFLVCFLLDSFVVAELDEFARAEEDPG